MVLKFIEATNGPQNWGKFLLMRFTEAEFAVRSSIDLMPLVEGRGWTRRHIWVLDLQTGEGAFFLPGGLVKADLNKHGIWVCPLYEPFLEWLYKQSLCDLSALPDKIDLPDAEFQMSGYRRPALGKTESAGPTNEPGPPGVAGPVGLGPCGHVV